MTEEHNIYHLPSYNPLAAAASVTHVHPQIITMHASAEPAPSMTISISEYNSLLSLFMTRGNVIRNAIHSLRARRDVAGTLPPCDEMLLEELEAAMEGSS